jgi:hypothetical protein
MKQYRRLAVLSIIILIALISVNTIYAQPSVGSSPQGIPFESSPTTHATDKSGIGAVTNPTAAYDTDLTGATVCTIPLAGNFVGFPSSDWAVRYIEFTDFTNADPLEFYVPPEWIDIKIRYDGPSTTDDKYRIVYRVDPDTTWYVLQDWVSGAGVATTPLTAQTLGRSFPDVTEPNDGSWSWTDVSNLVVRFETQMQTGNDAKSITLYEVWALVYPTPKPPTASTAISIQPSVVMDIQPGETFYVEAVVMGLTPPPGMWGLQVDIKYDTTVLTATGEWYTHYPFMTAQPALVDDPNGFVTVSFSMPMGEPVGYLGENTAVTRIYFKGDAGGTSHLNVSFGEISRVGAAPVYPPTYDGWASVDRIMSLVTGPTPPPQPIWIDPITEPITTWWHEIHPNYSPIWHLSSWEDGQPEGEPGYGELSKCDQIDMVEEATGEKVWFHVDEVTVTVHWEYKESLEGDPIGEYGAGEPGGLPDFGWPAWDPAAPPVGTGLHMIYPVFCSRLAITNWIDNDGDGKLSASDQMEFADADTFIYYWAHVTGISTDIYVSEKPPVPPWPEFPLGISLLMLIAPIIPLAYLWRLRKKVTN